ncbi:MAG: hypothetical protein H0Z35_11695 [Thermoanaerobacteraceae bacterium]|nr:hypothetical protein [Thermoanaerobacteraceae bacterium]
MYVGVPENEDEVVFRKVVVGEISVYIPENLDAGPGGIVISYHPYSWLNKLRVYGVRV